MLPDKPDQRVYQRFKARFPVKLKDSRDDYGTKVFLRDASALGLRITSRERMYINDRISLDVRLPDGHEPLLLSAQVIWVKTQEANFLWDVGLKFHQISLMKMQRLFQLVQPANTD